MVTTRSKTVQSHIDDSATKKNPPKLTTQSGRNRSTSPAKANVSKKRKPADAQRNTKSTSKRRKPVSNSTEKDPAKGIILINRAPVLQLWGACVTQFLYPGLEWTTCLSAGSAISTICAIAKGRSIGTIQDKDESDEKEKKRDHSREKQEDLEHVEVMQFKLKVKDGLVLVGSDEKGKPGNEELLSKKFGSPNYERVKKAFDDALEKWKGKHSELNKKAFGFYEEFRPTVKSGTKGWGKKGGLSLEKIQKTVS